MSSYTPNAQDQKKAENIRRQYISREENKMEQLQALDDKVKAPGKIAGTVLGVIGSLIMGAGMSLIMVWSNMTVGLVLSIPGLLIAAAAFPVYHIAVFPNPKSAELLLKLQFFNIQPVSSVSIINNIFKITVSIFFVQSNML